MFSSVASGKKKKALCGVAGGNLATERRKFQAIRIFNIDFFDSKKKIRVHNTLNFPAIMPTAVKSELLNYMFVLLLSPLSVKGV